MIGALWTAATGMGGQQVNIDVISNNLSNVNTTGYKKNRVNFQDMMYQRLKQPGTPNAQGAQVPVGIEVGHGARVSATQKIFSKGSLQNTGNPLDILIEGDGFFQVALPDGTTAYTKDGSLKLDGEGNVVTSDGYPIVPNLNVPPEGSEISITSDGSFVVLDGSGEIVQESRIQLVRFQNPAGLKSMGRNLFTESPASGAPEAGNPGDAGYGTIVQGFLEMSNVQVVEEMVNMIAAQRAYEVNSKAIQAADQMLGTASQLRR
ncbi:MAG: flagellar basal-body rod protein FlgG [Halanaerobiales bacterium]